MTFARTIKICAWSLGLLFLLGSPTYAQEVVRPAQSHEAQPVQTVLEELGQATVVYLGETHDSMADHAAQLEIIRALHQRHPRIAIGMEMFQRPFQTALDRFLQGEISELELRQQSQYDRRWGFPWANYAPILRFARENQLPVLALNTPTEVTRLVAQKGLDALQTSDRQWIPPIDEIRLDNSAYRQFLRPIYDEFHQEESSSTSFETFFLSQVLWDETMADGIASFLQVNPDYRVIVLTGQGHVVYGYGIPSRVARRMPSIVQRLVLLNPSEQVRSPNPGSPDNAAIADYLWFSPEQ